MWRKRLIGQGVYWRGELKIREGDILKWGLSGERLAYWRWGLLRKGSKIGGLQYIPLNICFLIIFSKQKISLKRI